MKKKLFSKKAFLLCIFFCIFFSYAKAQPQNKESVDRYFPYPEIIRFDEKSLFLNGERNFIYSGTFHYFRCPKELWSKRFQTIKDAGFNTVETYIPWNRHEKAMPKDLNDFSNINLTEFQEWMEMAESFGFYIIVRPGPFICAEYDRGGYPGWLTTLRPEQPKQWMWYRSDDPEYLKWADHWMKAFCQSVVNHQISKRKQGTGGIILFQVENEFSHVYFPQEAKINVYHSLINSCIQNGIEVPLIACESPEISECRDALIRKYIFETQNFYPELKIKEIKNNIDKLRTTQPDAPLMTTELQGGWFPFVWQTQTFEIGKDFYPETCSPEQIQNLTLYCIQNGQTILNFYMLFGGTNLDNTDSKDMQTSYDYGAAIREHGGVGEKYKRIKAIGAMLQEHGHNLATSVLDKNCRVVSDNKDVDAAVRFDNKGNRYIFIRNNNNSESHKGNITIKGKDKFNIPYELSRFDSKMIYLPAGKKNIRDGICYPQLSPQTDNKNDAFVPEEIKINSIEEVPEALPVNWKNGTLGESLLEWGIYDNRYVYYKAVFDLKKEDLKQDLYLHVSYSYIKAGSLFSGSNGVPDDVTVFSENTKEFLKKGNNPGDFVLPNNSLKEGANEFILLYENAGYTKEFVYMEKKGGIFNIRLLPQKSNDIKLTEWNFREAERTTPAEQQLEIANPDAFNWEYVVLENEEPTHVKEAKRGIFFKEVSFSTKNINDGKTALHISQMGDISTVFVNGKKMGNCGSRIYPVTIDLYEGLREGKNNIVIITDNYDIYAEGGVGLIRITYPEEYGIKPVKFQYAEADNAGSLKKQFTSDLNGKEKALIKWVKINFTIPENKNLWMPYFMALEANTNGKIYLNGNSIGRYWANGAQKDFYLPECWLNIGRNKSNEIMLQLKNTGEKLLQSVSFLFDPAFMEEK